MREQKQRKDRPAPLKVGDTVKYTVEAEGGHTDRTGTILLMDGFWCVIEHTADEFVWVSLRSA